jgi:CRP-like cAMP-binding protein
MQTLISLLQNTFGLPNPVSTQIEDRFQFIEINKGDLFLSEGKLSDAFLFLASGFMRSYIFDTEGNEVTVQFYSEGSVVFEAASFFQRKTSEENIQALADCTGWILTFDQLNNLFHTLPEFREAGRAMLVKTLVGLKMRTISMINQTAEQRYAQLLHLNPEIIQQAPLKYIASYLGITDTSLSRIRKDFLQK